MATFRSEPSFLIAILQLFKDRIGTGGAWTVEEIWQALLDGNRWREYDFEFELYRRLPGARVINNPQQWLTAVMQSLAELGLVAPDDNLEEYSGFQRWRIGDSWHPSEPPSGGDGGGGNVRPTADGDDDDGGGGLREALGHPVLLALPQDDFDELVNGLFGEVQP